MTVKEFIRMLQGLEQHREVVLFADEEGNSVALKFEVEYYEGKYAALVPLETIDPLDLS